ncbi:uncharacterized protein [Palaemon carinicauda]|uniref:uncharacterized protein n=1 Tax=Palaemon carinicauda TaxID=392227 RepID=UPI0035B614AE
MSDKEALVRSRGGYKGVITKWVNKIDSAIAAGNVNTLSSIKDLIMKQMKIVHDLNEKILALTTEEDRMKEVEEQAEYEVVVGEHWYKLGNAITAISGSGSSGNPPPTHKTNVRLPKLDLPHFTGDVLEWNSFWELYNVSVHQRGDLELIQKFSYLQSLLTGDALKLISGFKLEAANYSQAISLLSTTYGKKDEIKGLLVGTLSVNDQGQKPKQRSILPTATIVLKGKGRHLVRLRGLLDTYAERTFIRRSALKDVQYRSKGTEKIALRGYLTRKPVYEYETVSVSIPYNGRLIIMDYIVVDELPEYTKKFNVKRNLKTLCKTKICLADKDFDLPVDKQAYIDMLVGVDNVYNILHPGFRKAGKLMLLPTIFGYVVAGSCNAPPVQETQVTVLKLATNEVIEATHKFDSDIKNDLDILWNLDKVGIDCNELKEHDRKVLEDFESTIAYSEMEKQYVLALPWMSNKSRLPSNFGMALGRVKQQCAKFQKDEAYLNHYQKILKDQEDRGFIERKTQGRPYRVNIAPPLPEFRVQRKQPFSITGVDYTGALLTKEKQQNPEKAYIVLFTCPVTKGIHIELVKDLSCDSFLMVFRKFCSRRGFPSLMLSDNATTFVSTSVYLKNMAESSLVQEHLNAIECKWKFIPGRAPWFGAIWERLIGLLNTCLKKVIGQAFLSFSELSYVVTELEAIINDRPLSYTSGDLDQLDILTPNHLILGRRLRSFPREVIDWRDETKDPLYGGNRDVGKRFLYITKKCDDLWKRWEREYLTSLRETHRVGIRHESWPKMGDVVLIHDEGPRSQWKLGQIVKLHVGPDNVLRVVTLKTPQGQVMRPVVKLYPLELWQETDVVISEKTDNKST